MNEFKFDDSENRFSKDENVAPDVDVDDESFEIGHVLTLEEPVQLTPDKTITELVFKNKIVLAMVAHMPVGEVQNQKLGHMIPIIEGMTGQTDTVIKRLGWKDAMKAVQVVSYFLNVSSSDQEDGAKT
jgi:hypothetical protein